MSAPLLSREESIERVQSMLGGAITPWIFRLADGEFEGHLVVDPDIAWAALNARDLHGAMEDGGMGGLT